MTHLLPAALRILSRFWLEEVRADDLTVIAALPGLSESLLGTSPAALTELAVEYQRLFGFNAPPYESVFVDPSAMLMAPATKRVQALYRAAGWSPPTDVRAGAIDHLGLEMLALADWLPAASSGQQAGRTDFARRLHTEHLALWAPPFLLTVMRLDPHPFYAALADLTLHLLLDALPEPGLPGDVDPFPTLPAPARYDTEELTEDEIDLHQLAQQLVTPRQAGLYLTRTDIARLGQALELPVSMGDRGLMLKSLLRAAGQYELTTEFVRHLDQIFVEADAVYQAWADQYPSWQPYASAWRHRLQSTRKHTAAE